MTRLFERIFVVALIIFYSGALADFIPDDHFASQLKEVIAYTVFLITITLLLHYHKSTIYLITKQPLIWLLLALITFSPAWSHIPKETLNDIIPMIRVTTFALYLAVCFSLKEQIRLFTLAFMIAAMLSLLFAIALPQYGVVGMGFISNMEDIVHTGTWRGIYVHKTMLGTTMALGVLSCTYCFFDRDNFSKLAVLGLGLCVLMLIASTTTGALVFLVFVAVLVPFYRALRLHMKLIIPLYSFFLLVGGIVLTSGLIAAEQFLTSIGKDVTLTGRTIYWPLMLNKILERPWLGYGYKAFWHGGWKGEVADVWQFLAVGNEPPHAHNGYLNLWFDIGIIGVLIFFIGFVFNYLKAIHFVRITKSVEGFFPVTFLTFWILVNLTESFLVEPAIYWVIYVSIALSMYRKVNTY